MTQQRDTVYAKPLTEVQTFSFDERVAKCFPDMISRSVPGYETIIAMTGVLAERYAKAHTNIYDLGCSLGASLLAMRQQSLPEGIIIHGIDNSQAMLDRCEHIVALDESATQVALTLGDMTEVELNNASVVVLNFTLQFIPLAARTAFIERIFQAMNPGGILILSEKITFSDAHLQELNTDLHHSFKRGNGYSDLEIAQKRASIENYLVAESISAHQARLQKAGFSSADVWFQCFNFASFVAIK